MTVIKILGRFIGIHRLSIRFRLNVNDCTQSHAYVLITMCLFIRFSYDNSFGSTFDLCRRIVCGCVAFHAIAENRLICHNHTHTRASILIHTGIGFSVYYIPI